MTYHNVVKSIIPIGMWHGEAVEVELPLNEIHKDGHDGCAVLLQADVGGLPVRSLVRPSWIFIHRSHIRVTASVAVLFFSRSSLSETSEIKKRRHLV